MKWSRKFNYYLKCLMTSVYASSHKQTYLKEIDASNEIAGNNVV